MTEDQSNPQSVPLSTLAHEDAQAMLLQAASQQSAALLSRSVIELMSWTPADPQCAVALGPLAAVWAALDRYLADAGAGEHAARALDHLQHLLADEDLRWVLERRPRAALKWLVHLLGDLLEPGHASDDEDGDDGLAALDRDAIRRKLESGELQPLRTGPGRWYLSGHPGGRASRDTARAACRLWAALEASLLREFERDELQPLFAEFRALCRDRHFQQVLLLAPEAAAKWFHALASDEEQDDLDQ